MTHEMDKYLRTERRVPKSCGGDRNSGRIEKQAEFSLRAVVEVPDHTLSELRNRLSEERGEAFAILTVHDVFRRHGVSYKNDCARHSVGTKEVVARREA